MTSDDLETSDLDYLGMVSYMLVIHFIALKCIDFGLWAVIDHAFLSITRLRHQMTSDDLEISYLESLDTVSYQLAIQCIALKCILFEI